ncbi:MAG TPA: hypothetical protein VFU67_08375, partial [Nitrososphaeraceae archaeon]|nr:hypothetical protein [Nitrososphaeraceae archaeon]
NIMTSAHPDGEASGHIYAKGNTTGSQDIAGADSDNEGVSVEGTSKDLEQEAEEEAEKEAQEAADKIGEDDEDDEDEDD